MNFRRLFLGSKKARTYRGRVYGSRKQARIAWYNDKIGIYHQDIPKKQRKWF